MAEVNIICLFRGSFNSKKCDEKEHIIEHSLENRDPWQYALVKILAGDDAKQNNLHCKVEKEMALKNNN